MIRHTVVAMAIFAGSPALAQSSFDSMTLANDLGSVMASEDACGMSFNQEAIAAFIEAKVPADDMGFAGSLNMMTSGQTIMIGRLSPSQKTAHCTQMRRVAKAYGFTD